MVIPATGMSLLIWEGHGHPDGRLDCVISMLALKVNLSDVLDASTKDHFTLLMIKREKDL
jgi:hypothetical protein